MRRILILVALAAATGVHAQTLQVRQYAAKFVCGKATKAQVVTFEFAAASYYTVINVHNPMLSGGIEFRKKFALANPNEEPGKISEWFPVALKADQALQVDCGSIYKHLGIAPGTFIDGFVVLQLADPKRELDIEGVYTIDPGTGASSIDVEHVQGRLTQ